MTFNTGGGKHLGRGFWYNTCDIRKTKNQEESK